MSSTQKAADTRGLAGQTIGDTKVCSVNQTQLIYRGFEIADLAANATFEEVAFLLLEGHKPSSNELVRFENELRSMREPRPEVIKQLMYSPHLYASLLLLQMGVLMYLSC